MKSIIVIGSLLCLVSFSQAKPDIVADLESHKGEIAMLVKLGRWDKVEDLLSETLISKIEKQNIEQREDYLNQGVRSLKPPGPGAHVYGESNFQYRKTTNDGGDIQQSSGGHKVINSDGRVTEYRYGK